VINTDDHVVLVDSGAGDLAPTTGRLREHMTATGLSFEDIDTVITTHAHPDHIGGNTTPEGRPAFPKARYFMCREEWDFWTSERAERELGEHMAVPLQIARRHLSPTRERLELIDGKTAIVAGVDAIPAPGHTPGHLALMVSSMGCKLLILSDTVLHPIHLERPEWNAVFDFDPPKVVSTRRLLLEQAAADKALVFAFHFPFPGLGHVSPKDEGWDWQATEATV
jgi:glyoxylase-like metal-dependent hydrolase (beta-lactamase superfamily II)